MIMNLVVPAGNVRFVFYHDDTFPRTPFTIILWPFDSSAQCMVCVSKSLRRPSIVLNLANIVHDPLESLTMPLSSLDFSW